MSSRHQVDILASSSYKWEKLLDLPPAWQRKALSGEWMWIPRPKEQHEIFIWGSFTLGESFISGTLSSAARLAWRHLRFEVPEIGVRANHGQDGKAYMRYIPPQSNEEVDQWVDRTMMLRFGHTQSSFEDLRVKTLQMKRDLDFEQAFSCLQCRVEPGRDEFVESADFMLNFDHQITDGIGARILTGRFLSLLASALSKPDAMSITIDWEKSANNLSLPWIGLMNKEQVLSGRDYEDISNSNRDFILNKMVRKVPIHSEASTSHPRWGSMPLLIE